MIVDFKVVNIEYIIPFISVENRKIKEKLDEKLYNDYFDLTDVNNLVNVSTLPSRVFIGFYVEDKIIGYAVVMDSKPLLHLDLIYIQEEYRNRKIGKMFLNNFAIQSVYTNPANERAIDLYLSSGFKVKVIDPNSKNSIHLTRIRKYKDIMRI